MKKNFLRWLSCLLVLILTLSASALAVDVTDALDPFAEETEGASYADLNEKFADILELYKTYHLNQPTDEELLKNLVAAIVKTHPDLFDQLVDGMVNQTDRFNNFFTPEEYKLAFYPPDYVGIGVRVADAGDYVSIVEVFSGSPAKDAGIRTGDVIVRVDGKDVAGLGIERTGILIRGEEGTKVTVGVRRDGQILEFEVERRPIRTDSIQHEMMGNIAYISVRDFQDISVFLKFFSLLRDLSAAGAEGYIIDLRNNTGGDVDTALNMANCFIPQDNKLLATFYEYDETSYTVSSADTGLRLSNVAVLVNGGSYSSAEVMAGIMKDLGVATLVGTQTGGKGIGQNHLELKDGSVLTVTTSEVELPKSGFYHGTGISPDVKVENGLEYAAVPDLLPMAYEKTWEMGKTGPDVLGLEQRLTVLGYLSGGSDQVFDQRTADAVWTFQKDKGLATLTGAADPDTLRAVDKAIVEYMSQSVYKDRQLERALEIVTKQAQK